VSRLSVVVPLLLGVGGALSPGPSRGGDGGVPSAAGATYWRDVQPIVKERCAGCHGGKRPKGRLSLETLPGLLDGGKRGGPVVAGKPEESLLYLVVTGAREPAMPPEGEEPLSAAEVAVIAAWIRGGAEPGEPPARAAPYSRPPETPVYARAPAVAALLYSASGEHLFVGGYREVLVHSAGGPHVESASLEARLVGEAERILALALSPDGRLLAAAGGSPARFGEVQIWDLATRKLLRHVRLGDDTFFAVAFSPDGSRLATGGADRALHLLETESGEEVHAAAIHADWVFGLAFTADGERLVSAGRDRTVKVTRAADGKLIDTLSTFSAPVLRLAMRPGTALCLAGGEERTPALLDAREMKAVRKLEEQPGAVLAMAFSHDGKLVALGGTTGEVRVYEPEDGGRKATFQASDDWVYALAFRPGGGDLAAAGHDGVVRIWDLGSKKESTSFVPVPIGRLRSY
jgi:hypothetical protein